MVANAGAYDTYDGDDCPREFGTRLGNCKIPKEIDENESSAIIKFVWDSESKKWNTPEINPLFSTITGAEFSFEFDEGITDGSSGTWTYTLGVGDPAIHYFVAKGGNEFNLFSTDDTTDSWFTPFNQDSNEGYGLSHLTFYDTGSTTDSRVPEPASLLLLGVLVCWD